MKYFFLIALVLCTNTFAKIVDPSQTYRFLDTPHFKIVFNAQQQALAVHYSIQLEKAYAFLADRFSERPEKIVVIINDNTDSSNGYATPVPYPHMMIYPVLPLLQEPLGEPSSWSLELVTHEFTHILSFTPTNGFMYALKKIFGTIVVPNALMPLWWLEGVAVYNESTVNQGGRLRSTYQDSVLRSMQAAGNLEKFTIAEINEILPSYPSSRPYLFGSIFWNELIDQKGLSTIDILHQRQGGRIPYFINAPAVDLFGMSYEQLFSQGIHRLSRLYNDQIQTLQKVPPTPTKDLPWNEGLSYDTPRVIATQSPSISSDGKFMAVITTDEYLRKNLKLYQRGTDGFTNMKIWDEDGVEAIIDQVDRGTTSTQVHAGHQHGMDESSNLPSGSIQRVSWFPGKQKIIFDKVALATSFQSFSDLYTFDLETKKTKQISIKQRYREPHVSGDGKTIAFVEVSSGKTKVCLMLLENEKVVCLVESQFDEIYSWPTFLNEKSLLVTRRNSNGVDQLIEVSWEAVTMKFREANSYFALENSKNNQKTSLLRYPLIAKNKLYLVTNSNGVPNIARRQLGSSPKADSLQQVSHLVTGSLSFAVDPSDDRTYLTQITENGLQVRLLSSMVAPATKLPQITPVFLQNSVHSKPPTVTEVKNPNLEQPTLSDYSSWSYLIPRYWIPFVATSSQNSGLLISAQTGAMDPLQYHQYSLFGLYDTYLKRGTGSFVYINQQTPVTIALQASQSNTYLVTNNEPITNEFASFALLPDLFSVHKSLGLQVAAFYQNKKAFEENFKKQGGLIEIAYTDVSKSLSQITPNTGDLYSVGYLSSQDQTKKVDISQWRFDFNRFESLFLPRFHGLRLRAAGLVSMTKISSFYGESSTSYDQGNNIFLMRGYPNGLFTGRTFLNGQIEYRMPLVTLDRGAGTTPLFLKRLHMALIADTGRIDGFIYNEKTELYETVNTDRAFWNAGVEFKLDVTLGYHLPIQLVFGGYQAFDDKIVKNASSVAVQLRGLSL